MYLQYEVKSSCPLCYCFFLSSLAVIIVALLFSSPFLLLVCHSCFCGLLFISQSQHFVLSLYEGVLGFNQFILQNKLKIITKTSQHNQNFVMCKNINGRQFFSVSQWLHIISKCTGISLRYIYGALTVDSHEDKRRSWHAVPKILKSFVKSWLCSFTLTWSIPPFLII